MQWLSFYPDDFLEYPELFEGLDQDQRRRTRLAPREGANKVLLKFDLPAGAKIKPVDWYGTECVAIDLPTVKGFTITLAAPGPMDYGTLSERLAKERQRRLKDKSDGVLRQPSTPKDCFTRPAWGASLKGKLVCLYQTASLRVGPTEYWLVCELNPVPSGVSNEEAFGVLSKICFEVVRDLTLEGSPKHQCTSTVEDLKAGVVAYEKGGLKLALPEGWELRKSGGSSTVEIHGGGAKPLALIRKLAPKNGSLKTRVGADTVFSRRKARPDGFFGAGRALTEQEPFVVAFDYKDRSAEQVALCLIATGNELLTVEIIGTGVIEGEARRKLRDACLEMLKSAKPSATVANGVKDLNELIGWRPKE